MKPILTLLILLVPLVLSAQYQKGDWYLSGRSNVSGIAPFNSDETNTSSSLGINAILLGKFITDRLVIGAGTSFNLGINDVFNNEKFRLVLRPYARYYFVAKDERKTSFFTEAGIGAFSVFSGQDFFTKDYNLSAGAERQLAPGLLATATLVYFRTDNFNSDVISFGLGANILVGQLEKSPINLRRGLITSRANFGSLSYGKSNIDVLILKDFALRLNPEFGYFLSNRFQLSVALVLNTTIGSRKVPNSSFDDDSVVQLGFAFTPRLKYYLKGRGNLLPFVYAGISYSNSSLLSDRINGRFQQTLNFNRYGLEGGLGASYFLSPAVAFEGMLHYDAFSFGNNLNETRLRGSSLRLQCGFQFYFDRFARKE